MALLYTCEKCGKEISCKNKNVTPVLFSYKEDDEIHVGSYDLCVECSTKLHTLIKHFVADITADEARARGYIKGNQKADEVISKSENHETTHDAEMVSIPVEQYDSLNRMIAHYSDESERFKKCIDTIAESNKNIMDETLNVSKAILEAKMGVTLKEAMLNVCNAFSKEGENKNE